MVRPGVIARALADHTVITAYAQGWDRLNNGALLHAAEEAAVDILLTTDQRMRYQQNLAGRTDRPRGVDGHHEMDTRTVTP